MEQMYQMSINIHYIGVLLIIGVIGVNVFVLLQNRDIKLYAYKMRKWMPISTALLFLILFTGSVMMAAKHLEFTSANIVMILFSIVFIGLEVYRYKLLKASTLESFGMYKKVAYKLLGVELLGTLLITAWMVL